MDALTFIADMTKALAWPLTTAVLVLQFHAAIANLAAALTEFVRRVKSGKFAGVEVTVDAIRTADENALKSEGQVEQIAERLVQYVEVEPDARKQLVDSLTRAQRDAALLRQRVSFLAAAKQTAENRTLPESFDLFYGRHDGQLSPGRRHILSEFAAIIGPKKLADGSLAEARADMTRVAAEVSAGRHSGLNGGALTGLKGAGLLSETDGATVIGAAQLRAVAKELVVPISNEAA